MKRGTAIPLAAIWSVAAAILFFGTTRFLYAADDRSPARLEEAYDHESNPKKQVKIAVELIRDRLKELGPPFRNGDSAQETEAAGKYMIALDLLGKAIRKASSVGPEKDAEVELSEQLWQLGNLKTEISMIDQPQLEKVIQGADVLHQEILYNIMAVPKKPEKK